MDRKPEELQFLSAVGIVAESFKVLRSRFKLLGFITLTLVLPHALVILAHSFLTQPLSHKIDMYKLSIDEEIRDGSFDLERALHQIYRLWSQVLLIMLSYVALPMSFSLLYTSAVVYTVACLYTGKELTYATLISVVPRVWRRVMITSLWFVAIMLANYVCGAILLFMVLWILMNNFLWFRLVAIAIVVIFIVLICVHVYISMVWQLASVVSVVEDKYGLGAMQKSRDLIKGKRGTALALYIISTVTVTIISYLFKSIVVTVVGERFANGAVIVVVQCTVNVMWLLTQSMFYFVCKSYHHQSIDKSALSDHLEGYPGEYMPVKSAIQLENLDP